MDNKRFITLLSPTTIFSLLLLVALPLGFLLPASWGYENGPVENTQVIVILLSGVVLYGASKWGVGSRSTKLLQLWFIPVVMLVAARELSWGRVFYPGEHGLFLPLKALWYGKMVYPGIGIVIVCVIAGIYLQKLDEEILLWAKYGKFPIIELILIIGGFLMADIVEHHSRGIFAQQQDLFEELFELVMYCGVLSLFVNLGFYKCFQPYYRQDRVEQHTISKSTYF